MIVVRLFQSIIDLIQAEIELFKDNFRIAIKKAVALTSVFLLVVYPLWLISIFGLLSAVFINYNNINIKIEPIINFSLILIGLSLVLSIILGLIIKK